LFNAETYLADAVNGCTRKLCTIITSASSAQIKSFAIVELCSRQDGERNVVTSIGVLRNQGKRTECPQSREMWLSERRPDAPPQKKNRQ